MTTVTPLSISPDLANALDVVRGAGLPVMLVGSHGIGKSEFMEQYARQRGLLPFVLDLSLLEATDLTGLPYREDGLTRFAPPATLPASDLGRPSLLVLEELNRCDRSVRQPCLQLLTTRRLNDYRLPADCFLAACVNPDGAAYDVDVLDPALSSRFVVLDVAPDRRAWLSWAADRELHPAVVDFVRRFSQAFDKVPPRTWTHAAALVRSGLDQGRRPRDLEPLLGRLLGAVTGRALAMDLEQGLSAVEPEALLRDPAAYVERFAAWTRDRHTDRISAALDGLAELLEREPQLPLGARIAELHKVLDVVPPDLALPVLERIEARSRGGRRG